MGTLGIDGGGLISTYSGMGPTYDLSLKPSRQYPFEYTLSGGY